MQQLLNVVNIVLISRSPSCTVVQLHTVTDRCVLSSWRNQLLEPCELNTTLVYSLAVCQNLPRDFSQTC